MAELKTKPTNASVSDFLNAIESEEVRNDCKAIASIFEAATKTKPEMWGPSIIGFGRYEYFYRGGHSLEWMRLGFSPRKQNLTLYLMNGFDDYGDLLSRLGKHSTAKSCLYIKKLADVDTKALRELVTQSFRHMKQAHG